MEARKLAGSLGRAGSIAVVIASLVVAGCTSQVPATPATPTPNTAAPVVAAPTQAPPTSQGTQVAAPPSPQVAATAAPAVEKPRSGGIISYEYRAIGATWDSHRNPSVTPIFTSPIFSTLVRYNPAVKTPTAIIPDLAERWEISPDGKTYTFYLRKGVKWHNGQAFTAADVKYSLEKMTDSKRSSLAGNFPAFDRAEVVDDYAVKVYLKRPQMSFLGLLATDSAQMQAQHLANEDPKTTKFLVGTGPFTLKSYVTGVSYELAKNPQYYLPGQPYLDGIKIFIVPEQSAQIAAFASKQVQMMTPVLSMTEKDVYDDVKSKVPDAVYDWLSQPYGSLLVGKFETGQPWNNVRVRQAINLALDRSQVTAAGWGNADWIGGSVIGLLPYGGTYSLTQDEVVKTMGLDKAADARLATAKKLMADAGYANGFKARVLFRSGLPMFTKSLTVIADQLQRSLGIGLTLDSRDLATMATMKQKGDWDLIFDNVITGFIGDPDEIFSAFVTKSPTNVGGYSNPTVDDLFQKQSSATSLEQRQQIVRQLHSLLLEDLPAINLRWAINANAWYPQVKGYQVMTPGAYLNLRMDSVWLQQ